MYSNRAAAHQAQRYVVIIKPIADGALQTTLYTMINDSKTGKYYNDPSCIPAGTQLASTLNMRQGKVATQVVETSLIDDSHYKRKALC